MKRNSLAGGIILAAALALAARFASKLPVLSIFGAMIVAILLGMAFRKCWEASVVPFQAGIGFTSKYILRLGIILMGLRLNLNDILTAGWQTMALDLSIVLFALAVIHLLGRRYTVENKLTTLIAVGTGVCGAAAIGAIAPVIRAKDEEVAVSVAIIALLGTVFSIGYIALTPLLGMSEQAYGTFAGSTLHELAHVIAAAEPDGAATGETAILVKLGRVALLAPVAMVLGWYYNRHKKTVAAAGNFPVPWFLFGFLAAALVNTFGLLPDGFTAALVTASTFLLTMAMAAMGLNVNWAAFTRVGRSPAMICLIGSALLSLYGLTVIRWMGI